MSGADLPVDDRRILPALRREGFAAQTLLRNDTFAVLRAGTDQGWGIGVVCGTGLNCAGMTPEGRSVRFPALGAISGDILGGGGDLAVNAIGATIRAREGRGPRTELERLIPEYFGLRSPAEVLEHVHIHRIAPRRVIELAPVVLRAADTGDPVAEALVVQLSDELVSMVASAVRRLRLARRDSTWCWVAESCAPTPRCSISGFAPERWKPRRMRRSARYTTRRWSARCFWGSTASTAARRPPRAQPRDGCGKH